MTGQIYKPQVTVISFDVLFQSGDDNDQGSMELRVERDGLRHCQSEIFARRYTI